MVSIPFIAGQWSLQERASKEAAARAEFQSPSLRGSGRFPRPIRSGSGGGDPAFQSPSLRGSGRFNFRSQWCEQTCPEFQSPSLRGSGRFRGTRAEGRREARVSIPFIAGQWSLRAIAPTLTFGSGSFQSPSLRGSGRFTRSAPSGSRTSSSFNPLHCGAVVASEYRRTAAARCSDVSIPFIAGQWSLQYIQSLLHGCRAHVSIPFIAGQWSLPSCSARTSPRSSAFQSPSLRGSGRFTSRRRMAAEKGGMFQSPSLRGSGRFNVTERGGSVVVQRFQSPSLRGSGRFRRRHHAGRVRRSGFNPLHCGAVVASLLLVGLLLGHGAVSIPFIAGQWSLLYYLCR